MSKTPINAEVVDVQDASSARVKEFGVQAGGHSEPTLSKPSTFQPGFSLIYMSNVNSNAENPKWSFLCYC